MNILIIIPARGGSKGIPRKNLRKLGELPLIGHSIKMALSSHYDPDVYVSSEDEEIRSIAEQFGANTHLRNNKLSKDSATLDPVIYNAYEEIKAQNDKDYEIIITVQPTSPLLKAQSLDRAIKSMSENPKCDTIISAIDDTHLTWFKKNDTFHPNYEKRVNRQSLTPIFKETGGFLMTRNTVISETSRIGKNTSLQELSKAESIDIDTFEDWNLCEYFLNRKKILFVISGNATIGLGHVYNALVIANEILSHRIIFLVDQSSQLAYDKVLSYNYEVHIQKSESIIDDINNLTPDVIIHDCLDTEKKYIKALKSNNYLVINFEDLGLGAREADLVINAMYPEEEKLEGHFFGAQYFCARDEFYFVSQKAHTSKVCNVLVTYGGVDPNNLTYKTLEAIYDFCYRKNITITLVTGMGYADGDSLEKFTEVKWKKNVVNIATEMSNADLAFTSAGRTTFELAVVGTPAIVMAQNERELTHFFAAEENGFLNLGLGVDVDQEEILYSFKKLVDNADERQQMQRKMQKSPVKEGKKKVLQLIKSTIEHEAK